MYYKKILQKHFQLFYLLKEYNKTRKVKLLYKKEKNQAKLSYTYLYKNICINKKTNNIYMNQKKTLYIYLYYINMIYL